MTLAALSSVMPKLPDVAKELFAKVPKWFWKLGQAGQQLFTSLWFEMGMRPGKMRLTDWQIAAMCGRGLRWAQKAIRQLLDAVVDGEPCPLIDRYRVYGRRNESGRVIEIIIDFAAPEPKPKAPAAPRQTKRGPAAGPAPKEMTAGQRQAHADWMAEAAKAAAIEPAADTSSVEMRPDETPIQFLARMKEAAAANAANATAKKAAGGLAAAVAPNLGIPDAIRAAQREIAKIEAIPEGRRDPVMIRELDRLKARLASLVADDQVVHPARE